MSNLAHVEIAGDAVPSPELEQEQRVAVFDLVEQGRIDLPEGAPQGPYRLTLTMEDGRVGFDLRTEDGGAAAAFGLSLGPLAQASKDYRTLCAHYAEAVRSLPPARIEAADAARRAIHTEAARQLRSRLSGKAEVDEATARRLFTLICAMTEGV